MLAWWISKEAARSIRVPWDDQVSRGGQRFMGHVHYFYEYFVWKIINNSEKRETQVLESLILQSFAKKCFRRSVKAFSPRLTNYMMCVVLTRPLEPDVAKSRIHFHNGQVVKLRLGFPS